MKNIKTYKLFNESLKDKMKGKKIVEINESLDSILESVLNELLDYDYFDGIELNDEKIGKIYDYLSKEYKQMIIDMISNHGLNKYELIEMLVETIQYEDESFYENIKNMLENDN